MKSFKTKAGTDLPILDLRGKDYLQVAHRLVWFREEHPDWSIITEYVQLSENHAVAKATIICDGLIIATAHKCEDRKGFGDFIEKAETGAIGRALAACGYGTQFAPELAEDERIVDSPTSRVNYAPKTQPQPRAAHKTTTPVKTATAPSEAQILLLKGEIKKSNWTDADVITYLEQLGISKLNQLTWFQYESMLEKVKLIKKTAKVMA